MVDYIEKINDVAYGGNQFNGARTDGQQSLVSATFTMAAGAYKTISLANFLPNDGYDYYVTLEGYCTTGTSSGNTADMQIRSGDTSANSSNFYRRLCRSVTRASSAQMNGGSIEIPILRNNRNITIFNGDGNGKSGNMMIRISSYRRMGNNDSLSNRVEKIKIDKGINSNSYVFGGKIVDGDLKILHTVVFSGVAIAANGSKSSSVASIIPEDGYEYEALVSITTGSASTTNKQINLWCNDHRVVTYYTRSASNWLGGGNVWIRIPTNRQIVVTNPGTVATASTSMRVVYARRIGTNNDTGTYHSYECIPSKTLQPNTLIYGSPTISNGVVSNFSATNYLEIPSKRIDGEYVIKFTMPTSTSTAAKALFHSERFIALHLTPNTYTLYAHNWSNSTHVQLFTGQPDTTYWIKVIVNGNSRSFYYSTDGENYTTAASFTDSGIDSTLNYPLLLGMSSTKTATLFFLGSIDLSECYIKDTNGNYIWKGLEYRKLLPIGGNGFDGEWNAKYLNVVNGVTYGVNTSTNYTLVDYLPDDDNIYEILISGYARTGTTSGNAVGLWVYGNAQPSAQTVISYINTRYSSNYADAKSGTILCKGGKSTTITVSNSGSGTSGSCGVQISGYRRIGTNGS